MNRHERPSRQEDKILRRTSDRLSVTFILDHFANPSPSDDDFVGFCVGVSFGGGGGVEFVCGRVFLLVFVFEAFPRK